MYKQGSRCQIVGEVSFVLSINVLFLYTNVVDKHLLYTNVVDKHLFNTNVEG